MQKLIQNKQYIIPTILRVTIFILLFYLWTLRKLFPFSFSLNGIWSWWQFSFRFRTKWNSIWFKIERKTVITIISHSMWKKMETVFSVDRARQSPSRRRVQEGMKATVLRCFWNLVTSAPARRMPNNEPVSILLFWIIYLFVILSVILILWLKCIVLKKNKL